MQMQVIAKVTPALEGGSRAGCGPDLKGRSAGVPSQSGRGNRLFTPVWELKKTHSSNS